MQDRIMYYIVYCKYLDIILHLAYFLFILKKQKSTIAKLPVKI